MRYQGADLRGLALSVSSAIFQCLLNAQANPKQENHWRRHADRLESNFTTEQGMHYSIALSLTKPVKSTT